VRFEPFDENATNTHDICKPPLIFGTCLPAINSAKGLSARVAPTLGNRQDSALAAALSGHFGASSVFFSNVSSTQAICINSIAKKPNIDS